MVRDHRGHVIFYYSEFLGEQTNNFAELFAIAKGLELCLERNCMRVWVETDSQIALTLISNKTKGYWSLQPLLLRIRKAITHVEVRFSHTFREANAAADFLANQECTNKGSLIATTEPHSGKLKGILRLDRLEYPYIRCKR